MQSGCCRINPKNWESRHRRSSPQRKVRMRKNRSWTAFSAVVGLAALVVLASCQGPAGAAGATGAAGAAGAAGSDGTTGPAGPAGPAGTTDNASPVATAIPTVYLVVNGGTEPATASLATNATGYKIRTLTLKTYFTDTESIALDYKALSAAPTIATATAAAGKLTMTAVAAGTTTVDVTAHDGVTAGVTTTINVIVVANNSPPTVGVTTPIADLTGLRKLTLTAGKVTIPFTALINAGVSGEATEEVAFRSVVGDGASATKKYVSAEIKNVSGNSYVLEVVPKVAGLNDMSQMQEITIYAVDSFGAETLVVLTSDPVGTPPRTASLNVEVNAPPKKYVELKNVVLYHAGTGTLASPNFFASNATDRAEMATYTIEDFFAVEDGDTDARGDTTCVFSTDSKQARDAVSDTGATDIVDKDDMARVSGTWNDFDGTTQNDTYATPGATATAVMVNADDPAAATGTFMLTITCSDAEASVTSTATITVLNLPTE